MAVLADSKLRQLEYFESHAPIWMVHAGGVGLSGAAAAELTARTREARAAYDALVAIRAAALSATQVWYNMWGRMTDAGREDIRIIKAFAEARANPLDVYTLAQVEPPAAQGTSPLPGTPENFKVGLNPATGALTIAWKCAGGDGHPIYLVSRQFANQSAPTFLNATSAKTVTDATLGAIGADGGAMPVTYFITCKRGAPTGQTASITVRLGSGGASVSAAREIKMAA